MIGRIGADHRAQWFADIVRGRDYSFGLLEKSWLDVNQDPTPLRDKMRTKGFMFIADDSWVNGPFPDFYHSTFHARTSKMLPQRQDLLANTIPRSLADFSAAARHC